MLLQLALVCTLVVVLQQQVTGQDADQGSPSSQETFFKIRADRSYGNQRYLHCSTYCAAWDIMIVYGGLREPGLNSGLVDTRVYHFPSSSWSAPSVENLEPEGRITCALHTVVDSSSSCIIVLTGGLVGETETDAEVSISSWIGVLSKPNEPTPSPTGNSVKEEAPMNSTVGTGNSPDGAVPSSKTNPPTWYPTVTKRHGAGLGNNALANPHEANGTNTTWIVKWTPMELTTTTTQVPEERSFFCSTTVKDELYIFGGVSLSSSRTLSDMWRLRVDPDTLVASWLRLTAGPSTYTQSPPASRNCSMAYVNSRSAPNMITVYGGVSSPDVQHGEQEQLTRRNEMWYYSITSNNWISGGLAGPEGKVFLRERAQMVSYNEFLIMYGGTLADRETVAPGIFSTLAGLIDTDATKHCRLQTFWTNVMWCSYDQVSLGGWLNGRAGHACVQRSPSMWICFGGASSVGFETGAPVQVTADLITFDLKILSESDSLIVANEEFVTMQILFTALYVVFSLVLSSVLVVTFVTIRTRASFLGNDQESPYAVNRGARKSTIHKLPLVLFKTRAEKQTRPSLLTMGTTNEYHEKCSICLTEFEENEHLRQLPCKHLFHPECSLQWLQLNKACPICKQDIDTDVADLKTSQSSFFVESDNPLVSSLSKKHNDIDLSLAALRESIRSSRLSSVSRAASTSCSQSDESPTPNETNTRAGSRSTVNWFARFPNFMRSPFAAFTAT